MTCPVLVSRGELSRGFPPPANFKLAPLGRGRLVSEQRLWSQISMAERAPLEVTAVVVEGRGARDPAAELHAQLEEAKAAAIAAADRMQSLLQQMAMMEAAAAERRLAELNVRAELNRQQLACADQQAATSSTSRSVLVEPPQPAGANALTAEPRPEAKEAGVHQDERHHGIMMTDIFDDPDHKDEQAPIDTKLPFLLHDTSKADSPAPSAALSGSAARSSKAEAGRAPARAQLGTLMGVFVPCLQNILVRIRVRARVRGRARARHGTAILTLALT